MEPNFGSFMDLTMFAVFGFFAVTLVTMLVIVGVIVWILRRAARGAEDPAVTELKRRLAAGEISPVEYEVRLRALEEGG